MKIIDSHVHIFETLRGFNGKGELTPIGKGQARWANGEVVKMIPPEMGEFAFTAETCYNVLKENGVERAVLLQGSFYGFQNDYVAQTALEYSDMFIGAGTFDPMGYYADAIYNRLTNDLKMKILKFETSTGCGFMSYHRVFDIAEVFMPIAKKCTENNQTLVLDIGSPGMSSFQPESIAKIAKTFPELRIVVCHLLAPTLKEGDEEALKKSLNLLTSNHIYFDLAAIPFNVQPEEYPYPTGIKYIQFAKDIVGYDKLLWGTDIPSVLNSYSYQQLINYIIDSNLFTEKELSAILYDNAFKVYPFEV
ncbi:amidohydrolase family protein [Lachnotalea glycerini]|uniref:Amidohydrolase n=1 Tax=Lachnotalea glycerini TaxID=1763509 RepID=A0A371JEJ2_9FIRM|nr:amidohydrolase family protein [Lachnotalea glycerini]RDY31145.1 amidohydrolase [Lachnotalea glycerini]